MTLLLKEPCIHQVQSSSLTAHFNNEDAVMMLDAEKDEMTMATQKNLIHNIPDCAHPCNRVGQRFKDFHVVQVTSRPLARCAAFKLFLRFDSMRNSNISDEKTSEMDIARYLNSRSAWDTSTKLRPHRAQQGRNRDKKK